MEEEIDVDGPIDVLNDSISSESTVELVLPAAATKRKATKPPAGEPSAKRARVSEKVSAISKAHPVVAPPPPLPRPVEGVGIDSGQVHFAVVLIEYVRPDRAPIMTAARREAGEGSESGPRLRGERVRLLKARLLDLKRLKVQLSYDAAVPGVSEERIQVEPKPKGGMAMPLIDVLRGEARMIREVGPAVFGKSTRFVVGENPSVDTQDFRSVNMWTVAAAAFGYIEAYDAEAGQSGRWMEMRQKKAGVERARHENPGLSRHETYRKAKEASVAQWIKTMTENHDRGGIAFVAAMRRNGWKLDDIADAYNLAHQQARVSEGVTDAWLRNLEAANKRRGY